MPTPKKTHLHPIRRQTALGLGSSAEQRLHGLLSTHSEGVPIQIKRCNGRKLVILPNGETAPVRPWDVAPTSLQMAPGMG